MGMRKEYRAIAKARLEALGIDKSKAMGTGLLRSFVCKKSKTRNGRRLLAKYREAYTPLWKRVLWGKEAEAAKAAQMRSGMRKGRLRSARRALKRNTIPSR